MDRLPTLILLAALSAGCDEKGAAAPPRSRVDSVKARAPANATAESFCDVQPGKDAAAFQLPAITGEAPAATGWRWINVWATWCTPCVEEIPLIHRFRERLAGDGHKLALTFLSVDEDDAVVTEFRRKHPDVPAGPRIADAAALPAWFKTLGLDAAAPIPVHILVEPSGKIRCVRAGSISEGDFSVIASLVAQ